jgi:hypothetical protein
VIPIGAGHTVWGRQQKLARVWGQMTTSATSIHRRNKFFLRLEGLILESSLKITTTIYKIFLAHMLNNIKMKTSHSS